MQQGKDISSMISVNNFCLKYHADQITKYSASETKGAEQRMHMFICNYIHLSIKNNLLESSIVNHKQF